MKEEATKTTFSDRLAIADKSIGAKNGKKLRCTHFALMSLNRLIKRLGQIAYHTTKCMGERTLSGWTTVLKNAIFFLDSDCVDDCTGATNNDSLARPNYKRQKLADYEFML